MKALTYTVTNNNKDFEAKSLSRGYAYQTDTHFVHQYGVSIGIQTISAGLTAIEKSDGTLEDWIIRRFGAKNIQSMKIDVGYVIKNVWRPCLFYPDDLLQTLCYNDIELNAAERSLRLLMNMLDDLFLYIEPSPQCMNAYSHKTRELLILACSEVEGNWKTFMSLAEATPMNKRYTTKDYVKLADKLHLKEYNFVLKVNESQLSFRPYANWNIDDPSASLQWYDAYNKTKHNKTKYFSEATLLNCINAVVANLVLHCVRYGAYTVVDSNSIFSTLVQQYLKVELVDCAYDTFYLHKINLPPNTRNDFYVFNPYNSGYTEPFKQVPLVL